MCFQDKHNKVYKRNNDDTVGEQIGYFNEIGEYKKIDQVYFMKKFI